MGIETCLSMSEGMTVQTIDRAERAAKRRNKKIAQRYPLFAEQFATTVEAERKRLAEWQKEIDLSDRRRLEFNGAMRQRGDEWRLVVAGVVSAEEIATLDEKYERAFGRYDASYYPEFWWQQVKQHAPSYAHAHCPNLRYHDVRYWGSDGHCCTCGAPVRDWVGEMVAVQLVQLGLKHV